jgi:CheY-like chemotaxis protein
MFNDCEILIAEDNPYNFTLLTEMLNDFSNGYIWAKNGIEAINLLAIYKNISLILMDVNMPEIDGITVARKIREKGIETPIIFITAYGNDLKMKECYTVGGNDYLSKPFNQNELNLVLKKYIHIFSNK